VDARADPAAIGFELRLARPARADAPAEPRERVAGADQPRQQVLQLRELDLQLAFARARPAREDVENQLRAVDDLAPDLFLDLPQLCGRQLAVEDHDVHAGLRGGCGQRFDFAGAEIRGRIRFRPLLQHAEHDVGAGRIGEAGELLERALRFVAPRAPGNQADERGALAPRYAGSA